ncbi:MAG: ribonuclease III [Ruminococcaceae bacterium]|nr:ribonuclease III [Oscillospiraceae bacterium]
MTDKPEILSAASLAYIGDAVWELIVRQRLTTSPSGAGHPGNYALPFVTAAAQSAALARIEDTLTEEETAVYKRGRNCVHGNVPKSASPVDYRRATGLEALMGHLWLCGKFERAVELFNIAFPNE